MHHAGMSHRIPLRIGRQHFCDDILQDRIAEHLLDQQFLEAGAPVLKGLQPASIRHVHPAKLCLELVKGCRGDAVLAAGIRRLRSGLRPSKSRKSALPCTVRGALSVSLIDGLYSNLEEDQGLRSVQTHASSGELSIGSVMG
jgi:hypothetical protein